MSEYMLGPGSMVLFTGQVWPSAGSVRVLGSPSVVAEQLPEADAVLGFDSYAALSGHLRAILAGSRPPSAVRQASPANR